MKKDNVPQDKSSLVKSNIKELCYAINEEGNYETVLSTGWEAKALALNESMELINDRIEEARNKVLSGELSPIAFYMEVNKMDICVLSSYVKIIPWFVKRHLKPKNFIKLKKKTLNKYAGIFNITIDQLKDIESVRNK